MQIWFFPLHHCMSAWRISIHTLSLMLNIKFMLQAKFSNICVLLKNSVDLNEHHLFGNLPGLCFDGIRQFVWIYCCSWMNVYFLHVGVIERCYLCWKTMLFYVFLCKKNVRKFSVCFFIRLPISLDPFHKFVEIYFTEFISVSFH